MKKILDWTLGGIFRTIGRFIGFVVIGTLVAFFISKSDLKITDLLGIDYVNAATTTAWSTAQVKVGTCHDDTCSYGSNYDEPHTFSGSALDNPVYSLRWRVKAGNGLSSENSYTFSVSYKPTPDSLHFKEIYIKGEGDVSKENITCTNGIDNNGYYTYKCTFTPLEDYSSTDYLYITINFYQSYQTSLATKISKYEERLGTNAVITQQTNEIINQNQQNTQNIINNNNENTQTIINNQNSNTQQQINSQKVCNIIDKSEVKEEHKYLYSNGEIFTSTGNFGITDYINIRNAEVKVLEPINYNPAIHLCYYTINKLLISCQNEYNLNDLTIPNNAEYIRFSIQYLQNIPNYEICRNGNQALSESIHGVGEGIHDLNDSINSNDTTDSSNAFLDFMNNFNETDFGLASIITSPLTIISNLSTGTCSPISVGGGTGLFEGVSFELPCAMPFYEQWFGSFLELYQMITFGIISYKILLDLFRMIHNFRNPNDDRIEVLDL